MERIDLRSDTVTKPTPEMLQAMIQAPVGDDVFAEDPTVIDFQHKVAKLFGKENGIFVPSGTMSNQIGIHLLTRTGEEVIIHESGHIFNYEATSAAWLSNIQLRPVTGKGGIISADSVRNAMRPKNEWDPHTSVISLENTTNKGGGAAYSREQLLDIKALADELGLTIHLDGARIWNAIIATGIEPEFFGTIADTISVCFSKGLGAPVGSMLLGSNELIKKARRVRKSLGGGMRQVGVLAAAADYALEHHWKFLEEDHRRATELARVIDSRSDMSIDMDAVQSNIVIFELKTKTAAEFLELAKDAGILLVPFGSHKVRVVYHFQISQEKHEQVLEFFTSL